MPHRPLRLEAANPCPRLGPYARPEFPLQVLENARNGLGYADRAGHHSSASPGTKGFATPPLSTARGPHAGLRFPLQTLEKARNGLGNGNGTGERPSTSFEIRDLANRAASRRKRQASRWPGLPLQVLEKARQRLAIANKAEIIFLTSLGITGVARRRAPRRAPLIPAASS